MKRIALWAMALVMLAQGLGLAQGLTRIEGDGYALQMDMAALMQLEGEQGVLLFAPIGEGNAGPSRLMLTFDPAAVWDGHSEVSLVDMELSFAELGYDVLEQDAHDDFPEACRAVSILGARGELHRRVVRIATPKGTLTATIKCPLAAAHDFDAQMVEALRTLEV